eukprot:COSAG01_NODE_3938_length_5515_cov_2.557607_1_plen_90_part_00
MPARTCNVADTAVEGILCCVGDTAVEGGLCGTWLSCAPAQCLELLNESEDVVPRVSSVHLAPKRPWAAYLRAVHGACVCGSEAAAEAQT